MSTPNKKRSEIELEGSELWQLSKSVAEKVRKAVEDVPYTEYYILANSAIQNATSLTSDIAMVVGKGLEASSFDYRYARGHLFTAKGLLLMAKDLGFVKDIKSCLDEMEKLQTLIEKELPLVELKKETNSP